MRWEMHIGSFFYRKKKIEQIMGKDRIISEEKRLKGR